MSDRHRRRRSATKLSPNQFLSVSTRTNTTQEKSQKTTASDRTTSSSARQRVTPVVPPSNKRTRGDSSASTRPNRKKKEIVYDDDDEEEEIRMVSPKKHSTKVQSTKEEEEEDRCAICLDNCTDPKKLDKCSHTFCAGCIDHYFEAIKPQCPCCFTIYGELRGNQPIDGTMTVEKSKQRLPGFENGSRGSIRITYHFSNGIQDDSHPNPGQPYRGTTRQAYLPDNHEGRHVLKLLEKAFQQRHIFTVGQSRTTGYDNVVTWNDIHHKTSVNGGVENFGYPDKTYLNRVQQELAAKGIQ